MPVAPKVCLKFSEDDTRKEFPYGVEVTPESLVGSIGTWCILKHTTARCCGSSHIIILNLLLLILFPGVYINRTGERFRLLVHDQNHVMILADYWISGDIIITFS